MRAGCGGTARRLTSACNSSTTPPAGGVRMADVQPAPAACPVHGLIAQAAIPRAQNMLYGQD